MEKFGLQLLDKRRRDGQGHENGKHARLHVNVTVSQMPESECVEKSSEDM